MTKQQATEATYGSTLHYGLCSRSIGPRGGVKTDITEVRVSGRCQTWVTRPADFRLPIKYGLYENGAVTQDNADLYHLAQDCPLDHGCQQPECHQVLRSSDGSTWQHTHRMSPEQRAMASRNGAGEYIVIVPGDSVDARLMAAQTAMGIDRYPERG